MRSAVLALSLTGSLAADVVMDPLTRRPIVGGNENYARTKDFVPHAISVDYWNAETKTYTTAGSVQAKYFLEETDPSGHAPHNYAGPEFVPTETGPFPTSFYGGTFTYKYWEMLDMTYEKFYSNETTQITAQEFSLGFAPSQIETVYDASNKVTGHMFCGGDPAGDVPSAIYDPITDPETGEIIFSRGSVSFLPIDEAEGYMVFPNDDIIADVVMKEGQTEIQKGMTINTMKCQKELGLCLFTEWSKDTGSSRDPNENCFYWCEPDDVYNPTRCVKSSKMLDERGELMCGSEPDFPNSHFGGGVHALGLGPQLDSTSFELLIVYTGGFIPTFDYGVSHIEKMTITYDRSDPDAVPVVTEQRNFGEQLWNDTVEGATGPRGPLDVGADHIWVDGNPDYFWVSAYRRGNAGLHMLDMATGELILSLREFNLLPHDPTIWSYPAGVAGFGEVGKLGSFVQTAGSCGEPEFPDLFNRDGFVSYVPTDNLPGFDEWLAARNN
jgi:hypothetical protein